MKNLKVLCILAILFVGLSTSCTKQELTDQEVSIDKEEPKETDI